MEKKTGVVVPLAALYTKECAAAGDFLALKPFADFCKKAGLSIIQLLPVNDTGTHSSPYSGLSAFALHPMYIRLEALPEFDDAMKNDKAFAQAYRGFIKELKYQPRFDYARVSSEKVRLLHLLYAYIDKKVSGKAKKSSSRAAVNEVTLEAGDSFSAQFNASLDRFVKDNPWVIPYAVFKNLKDAAMQASWKSWDENLRHVTRDQIQLRWANRALRTSHNFFVWCQMRAAEQFSESSGYVRGLGITLKGDIPILMNEDSADCWAYPEFFNQELRAGSPPDGENPVGQNWGFPTYNWTGIAADGYSWWRTRVQVAARYYDAFRIDHILGFFRIWAVPEKDTTAFLGHTEPCRTISRAELNDAGFSDDRIRWLSRPHVPTGLVEDITWNHDEAVSDLEKVCERVGGEELWLFKEELLSDGGLYSVRFHEDERKDSDVRNALILKWRDRALIELKKDVFVPVYNYEPSTAWRSLSDEERRKLSGLFEECGRAQDALWREQAMSVLGPIVSASKMIPCAEDLGANLRVLPEVLKELNILSLKVIRWNRDWAEKGQPFYDFSDYPEMSVSTTSVHDSSTLRQWWNEEKNSAEAYIAMCRSSGTAENLPEASADFNADIAQFVLSAAACSASAWLINPMQDYLYLEQRYYLEDAQSERINVPGSVNDFNWTYRLPVSIEELSSDESLVKKINSLVRIHDEKR